MKEGVTPGGIEYYLPLFFTQTATLFDYLADDALFVLCEGAADAADQFWTQTAERYDQRAHDIERPVLPPAELYLPPDDLRAQLNQRLRVEVVEPGHAHAVGHRHAGRAGAAAQPQGRGAAAALRQFIASYPGRVLIAADSAGRREALLDTLANADLHPQNVEDWPAFSSRQRQAKDLWERLQPRCLSTRSQEHAAEAASTMPDPTAVAERHASPSPLRRSSRALR